MYEPAFAFHPFMVRLALMAVCSGTGTSSGNTPCSDNDSGRNAQVGGGLKTASSHFLK